jgi:hypothetical protein
MEFRDFIEGKWTSVKGQRELPFMHEPGYLRKATSFVDPNFEDPDADKPDCDIPQGKPCGFQHSTTSPC